MAISDFMETSGLYECPVESDAAAPVNWYPLTFSTSTSTQSASLFSASLVTAVRGIVLVSFRYTSLPSSPTAGNQQIIVTRASDGVELTRITTASSINAQKICIPLNPAWGFGLKWGGTNAVAYSGRMMWKWYGG